MALYANSMRRPSEKGLYWAAAAIFPLLVLVSYFKSYYFRAFFDVKPLANALVHAHGIVMTLWVIYFSAQIALVRSKNVRLHMTLGTVGVVMALLVIFVGLATAYDAHIVRRLAPPGVNPDGFFLVAVFDVTVFAILFGTAILLRRRPLEHKSLMLLTAINFLPAAFVRLMIVPEKYLILWAYGFPDLIALGLLAWQTIRQRRLNLVFTAAVFLLIGSQPLRIMLAGTELWLNFAGWLAALNGV